MLEDWLDKAPIKEPFFRSMQFRVKVVSVFFTGKCSSLTYNITAAQF